MSASLTYILLCSTYLNTAGYSIDSLSRTATSLAPQNPHTFRAQRVSKNHDTAKCYGLGLELDAYRMIDAALTLHSSRPTPQPCYRE